MKKLIPWRAKLWGKVVLSRVPVRYRVWRRLDLFVHGHLDRPKYALRVIRSHLARVGWKDLAGKSVLELGPGDILSTAVIACAFGARQVYLVDSGAYAEDSRAPYLQLAHYLRGQGIMPPDLSRCESLAEVLARCNARYFTDGVNDLRRLPEGTVDLTFSQAVLEHVRREDLAPTIHETYRVAAPGGIASHQVELKDHLGGALNHLRFSRARWEAHWMTKSGFYTNRVRFPDMIALFREAGWQYEFSDVRRWKRLPTSRASMDPEFRGYSDDDLLVSQFDIVARHS